MIYKCLLIFGIMIGAAICNNTVPVVELKEEYVNHTSENLTGIVMTTVKTSTDIKNLTSLINNTTSTILNIRNLKTSAGGKTKAVLIINSPSTLRQGNGKSNGKKNGSKNKNNGIQNLLYIEYDDDGAVITEFMMNNLEDVSRFFEHFLHTKLCHGSC